MTDPESNQSKALRLLKAIYDVTRNRTTPVFIDKINIALPEEDLKAAWRYLKDKGLIHTFSIPYTARINGAGVDAIESAQLHQQNPNFPSVTNNIVNNIVNIGTMSGVNSPIQQAGTGSTQTQEITYGAQDLADLNRLVSDLTGHLDGLRLDSRQKQKAEAQIATLRAQLTDEPDPAIVRQVGRSLRNITEGAIGSLIASGIQATMWTWVIEAMHRLFV